MGDTKLDKQAFSNASKFNLQNILLVVLCEYLKFRIE